MISLLLFGAMAIVFHESMQRLAVVSDVRRAFRIAPSAVAVMRSTSLTDLEKERQVRRMSVDMLRVTAVFSLKIAVILVGVLGLAAVTQWAFELSPDGLVALLASWQAIGVMLVVALAWSRLRHV